MAINNIIKTIIKHHHYKITSEYWGRIGMMHKRYGEDILKKAIEELPEEEISLTLMLNIIENKCQFIIENGEMDDLTSEILNII